MKLGAEVREHRRAGRTRCDIALLPVVLAEVILFVRGMIGERVIRRYDCVGARRQDCEGSMKAGADEKLTISLWLSVRSLRRGS